MALPPWTVDLLRRGVADLARQATDHDAAAAIKEQASKLVDELPRAAREKVDALLRQADARTQPMKDAWQSGAWWRGAPMSLAPTRVINGTGCLLDHRGSGVGLPAAALASAIAHLSGDAARDPDLPARLCDEIATSIASRRDHASANQAPLGAIVTNSFDASLALVTTLGGRGGCLWVPRSSAHPMPAAGTGDVGGDLLVDRLRRYARGSIREFGHASGSEDWPVEQTLPPLDDPLGRQPKHRPLHEQPQHGRARQNVVVRLPSSALRDRAEAEPRGQWIDTVVLPVGSVFAIDPSNIVANVIGQLDRGADLVVLGGGVLAGTPELGLVVGTDEVIKRLRQCPSFDLVKATTAMTALVATSIAIQADGTGPVGQLLDVSQDNLADRAQRLATQLAGCEWVTATRITEEPAKIGVPPERHACLGTEKQNGDEQLDSIASRQVVLTIDGATDPSALAQRLANGSTGLLCRVEDQEIVMDLRWISPEQQTQISERVCQQN